MSDTYATPRWVKVLGFTVILMFLLIVVLKITGNAPFRGPGGHKPPIENEVQ